jgi:raffinose/stachyose/melibiose transport system permease protein
MISRAERLGGYLLLFVFAAYALIPVLGATTLAVRERSSTASGFDLSGGIHLENFKTAWEVGHFGAAVGNSVIVAVAVVTSGLVLSTLAAFAFGTMQFRGRSFMFALLLMGMLVPIEVTIIPLYYGLRAVALTDTHLGLILPQVAAGLSFGVFWMRAFFLGTPQELLEAARVDGASTWRILRSVLLPLAVPALLTLSVLAFIGTWNEFLIPLVIGSSSDIHTVPLALSFYRREYQTDYTLTAAAAVMIALPVVVVYVALQRHFIQGIVSGALKE